jgi:hypothetical protein
MDVTFYSGGCTLAGTFTAAAEPGRAGPREYRRAVRQPVSPEYLELVTGWVTKRWGARV